MKKFILIPVAVLIAIVSSLLVMYFLIGGGSASSNCSSLFVTCNATCQETFLYSTAHCEGKYFHDCKCDGLMKKQTKSISADSVQLKHLGQFIDHVAELQSPHKDDLIATLNAIKITIAYGNYEAYKSSVDQYFDIVNELSAQQKQHLDNWLKQHQ